jgi:broad specificity phosphatase PhoE
MRTSIRHSTRLRAMQTAKGLGRSFPVLQVPMLDELKFGVADSLTHAEVRHCFVGYTAALASAN